MRGWLKKLLVPCPKCEEISRRAGGGLYAAVYRRYHKKDNHLRRKDNHLRR